MTKETLNELSKKTLASYISKAKTDRDLSKQRAKGHMSKAASYEDDSYNAAMAGRSHNKKKADEKSNREAGLAYHYQSVAAKRSKGIDTATKKFAKEDTELQELSKKTLARYIDKASKRAVYHSEMGVDKMVDANNERDPNRKARLKKDSVKHNRKSGKRLAGISKAASKLAKEETELQELSKKTLGSYIKKANMRVGAGFADSAVRGYTGRGTDKKTNKKTANSITGINRAVDRLTKEETEMNAQELLNAILEKNYEEATTIFVEDMNEMVRKTTRSFIEEGFVGSEEISEEEVEAYIDSLTDEEIGALVDELGEEAVEEMAESMAEIIAYLGEEVEEGEEFELSEEDLQELSKKTLASYIGKAAYSAADRGVKAGKKEADRDEVDRFTNRHGMKDKFKNRDEMKKMLGSSQREVDKARDSAARRAHYVGKAADKLAKD